MALPSAIPTNSRTATTRNERMGIAKIQFCSSGRGYESFRTNKALGLDTARIVTRCVSEEITYCPSLTPYEVAHVVLRAQHRVAND